MTAERKQIPWWIVKGAPNPALSDEVRRKISESRKGATPWWVKRERPNPATLPDVRARISLKARGRVPWNKGIERGPEFRALLSRIRKARPSPGQFKKGHVGYSSPESRRKALQAALSGPTRPELAFLEICRQEQLPFKYVGNGKFFVHGFNPDFISTEDERVAVDIFGDYWHSPLFRSDLRIASTYGTRKKIFRQYGWKLVIIWESELSNKNAVLKKLDSADGRGEIFQRLS